MVSAWPPLATHSRVISASPRVINAARPLSPSRGLGDAAGDRDDVLHRAADLRADHVADG